GLTPNHADLTQLLQALNAKFAQRYISTPITKTVHGAGADFADLNAAMAWVGQYIITPTGSVTFAVAAGKFTYTQPVEINHQNANRITIQGAALLGAAPLYANFAYTAPHSSTDGTNNIIYLRGIFATELSFNGGVTGFKVFRGGATLRNLLITGSQTTIGGRYDSNGISMQADIWIDTCAIWGFGRHGIAAEGCSIFQ